MSAFRHSVPLPDGRTVHIVSTDRADGDFFVGLDERELVERRAAIHAGPWTWLQQVHGKDLVHVAEAGHGAGRTADGAVTLTTDAPIAVTTADCAPVVLVSTNGVAVVHAGWRGALAGIVGAGAEALVRAGGQPVASFVGPCIHPGSYEFGAEELQQMVDAFGDGARGETGDGRAALDMPAVVGQALDLAGWGSANTTGPAACTSAPDFFSHRTRGDAGRQTTVAWIEAQPGDGTGS